MFEVCILGTNSAIPAFGRYPTAQVVKHFGNSFLIDCGEATQIQAIRFKVRLNRMEAIFISHMHGDHVHGLPGLVTSLSLGNRQTPLTIIGPTGIKDYLEFVLKVTYSTVRYELNYIELDTPDFDKPVYETKRLEVYPLPLQHRVPTFGYLFKEKPKKRKFLFHQAKQLEVPNHKMTLLKQGNSIQLEDGRTVTHEQVTGEPDRSYSYAFCSDTCFHPPLAKYIDYVDLLYHEATFLKDQEERAAETKHSTAQQAAEMARLCNADALFLGHYSARYRDLEPVLAEARETFPNSYLALEGQILPVPFRAD